MAAVLKSPGADRFAAFATYIRPKRGRSVRLYHGTNQSANNAPAIVICTFTLVCPVVSRAILYATARAHAHTARNIPSYYRRRRAQPFVRAWSAASEPHAREFGRARAPRVTGLNCCCCCTAMVVLQGPRVTVSSD